MKSLFCISLCSLRSLRLCGSPRIQKGMADE
jgi:hypothetical protein